MAGLVRKRKVFSSVLIFSKKKNQHRTFHLDPQRACFMVNPNRINVMFVRNCMNIPKYTLIGYISLSNGGWIKIKIIDLRCYKPKSNNFKL